MGDDPLCGSGYSPVMQLIQIGEVKQKTILDMVQEMAARQLAEVEQLKRTAEARASARRPRRMAARCSSVRRPN